MQVVSVGTNAPIVSSPASQNKGISVSTLNANKPRVVSSPASQNRGISDSTLNANKPQVVSEQMRDKNKPKVVPADATAADLLL